MATDINPTPHSVNSVVSSTAYNDLHNQFGHAHKETVLQTAKTYNISLNNIPTTPTCEDWEFSIIKVKNLVILPINQQKLVKELQWIFLPFIKSVLVKQNFGYYLKMNFLVSGVISYHTKVIYHKL
jgi:hypothetical protein